MALTQSPKHEARLTVASVRAEILARWGNPEPARRQAHKAKG
ncbi:hypothetical protein [Galactobacter sp.]|nr:hypothetical protein [Galactobacter sp.]